jgi:NADPH:quinone reductase-like Zn-dependent oxidoreductase
MVDQMNLGVEITNYTELSKVEVSNLTRPVPAAGEVLVRVHASGVNPVDWKLITGMLKDFMPLPFPFYPGADLAGVVEAVGPGVTTFQVGNEVFGQSGNGTYMQYTVAPVETLALKPPMTSFVEAATIPIGATTAWQGLFDHGKLEAGQRVLILGGSGGVGLFAIQFAHGKGAYVITTTSAANVEYVRELGADEVIDYTKTKVEDAVSKVDLILDTVGGAASANVLPLLNPGGTFITTASMPDEAKALELGVNVGYFSAKTSSALLSIFARLLNDATLVPTVQKVFPLMEAAQALILSQQGHGRGRIVLQTV